MAMNSAVHSVRDIRVLSSEIVPKDVTKEMVLKRVTREEKGV